MTGSLRCIGYMLTTTKSPDPVRYSKPTFTKFNYSLNTYTNNYTTNSNEYAFGEILDLKCVSA
jgi:hypothetical protein